SAYFHRIYRQAFGVTLRQDVIESRLIAAAELLETTDLSVSAIAERCGYFSDSYFMRQFRLHKGCTPTEYRRRAAEK
ncbi:MAG TPA: AraC family transcriptional regulator, partial [Ruminococcus sp.]|nr:AraC family transcriptional regulator [Ruminococcus sp.]